MTSAVPRVGGEQLHGMALVCLHGFMGCANDWDELRDLVGPDIQVAALDLPGHGSHKEASGLTFESVSAEVLEGIDALGLQQPHLLGYSMGGRIALHMVCHYPDRFASLILESVSPGLLDPVERTLRCSVDDSRGDTLRTLPLRDFLEDWYRQPLFASLAERPDLRAEIIERKLDNDPTKLADVISAMSPGRQAPLWDRLPNLRCPILLIAGELDSKYRNVALAMDDVLPNAELSLVDGAGHCVHAEHPHEMAHRLKRFLKGQ